MSQMNKLTLATVLLASIGVVTAMRPAPVSAQDGEQEFTCRDSLFGTRSCESRSGTTIKSRPDLFGNTNSTVTSPDGSTMKCRSRQGLFGTITTVCE